MPDSDLAIHATGKDDSSLKFAFRCSASEAGIFPDCLYHASPATTIIDRIEPRIATTIGGETDAFVFAGEDFLVAHAYALKTGEMMCIQSMPGSPGMHVCVIRDREKALREGISGMIYELPPDNFEMVLYDGKPSYEWISTKPVPVDRTKATYVTMESAMEKGIQIFFAVPGADLELVSDIYEPTPTTFENSKLAALLNQGLLIWENRERGIIQPLQVAEAVSLLPTAKLSF